jgi:carboxypeptidase C (cathepsin A)
MSAAPAAVSRPSRSCARCSATPARLGSRYDSNVTALDPFPNAPEQQVNDPILDAIIAPTTSAIVDFTTRIVGWKPEGRYDASPRMS